MRMHLTRALVHNVLCASPSASSPCELEGSQFKCSLKNGWQTSALNTDIRFLHSSMTTDMKWQYKEEKAKTMKVNALINVCPPPPHHSQEDGGELTSKKIPLGQAL